MFLSGSLKGMADATVLHCNRTYTRKSASKSLRRHLRAHYVNLLNNSSDGRHFGHPYDRHVKRPGSCAAGSASDLPSVSELENIHLEGEDWEMMVFFLLRKILIFGSGISEYLTGLLDWRPTL